MRDIVALVFGGEPDEACETRDERMCGGHTRPGQWCQTQPGHAALEWLRVSHGARDARRDERRHGPFGMRIF